MDNMKWIVATCLSLLILGCGESDTPKKPSASAILSSELSAVYTVTKDEYMGPIKRSVEVLLEKKISDRQLAEVAIFIRSSALRDTERTFIGYYLKGVSEPGYWATSHFNPELKVDIKDAR
ncbi:hypothetical protein EGJ27_21540 [Pseudomonas sp. v388]|uniref:hypothetical protein n=1 Tax=Pseudomonas sp. v388 TaxID=2479849 RepID=UPI000F784EB1|nr:hypothetical protein [Pseudomonas sp. v388]RRV04422.1 hypothetical protein EGJ27_21540 [Pseudomonas sp. v388]